MKGQIVSTTVWGVAANGAMPLVESACGIFCRCMVVMDGKKAGGQAGMPPYTCIPSVHPIAYLCPSFRPSWRAAARERMGRGRGGGGGKLVVVLHKGV